MQKINFKNLPDTSTPLNASTLNQMQDNIESAIESAINSTANLICPIGKVEVFFDNQDHSNYLGFTWVRTSIGRVPVGIDENDEDFDTIGNTGGEKTHTLIEGEIPPLKIYPNEGNNDPITGGYSSSTGGTHRYLLKPELTNNTTPQLTAGDANKQTLSHNNMPPYEVMAFWKRVS